MYDPHEEEVLDLPEMNQERIRANARDIKRNRRTINGLFIVIALLLSAVGYLVYKQHTLENCQAKLFTHLTKQKAPTLHELKRVNNPTVYKALFTECE